LLHKNSLCWIIMSLDAGDPTCVGWESLIERNPYEVRSWTGYLEATKGLAPVRRYAIYERALHNLARSYKLWHAYLLEREANLESKCVTDQRYLDLINTYERALVYMNKMPRIWCDYCSILVRLQKGSQTRRTFDRAMQALPITQHEDAWGLYIK